MQDTVYKKSADIVFRKIADECILVPIKHNARDMESIYALNEVASCVWELIDGHRSCEDIKDIILNEFEVSPTEAAKDVRELCEKLEDAGTIIKILDGAH